MTPLNPVRAALDAALREDFHAFARKVFSVVLPGERFKPNWHFNAIAHALELCLKRRTKRLLITVPPRSGKSILCSVALPAFILGKDPTQRIVCASTAKTSPPSLAATPAQLCKRLGMGGSFPRPVCRAKSKAKANS